MIKNLLFLFGTLILLGFLILFSFNSNENVVNYSNIFQGKWLNKEYLELVNNDKSPFKTFHSKTAQQIIGIEYIPSDSILQELNITSIHEGDKHPFTINEVGIISITKSDEIGKSTPYFKAELKLSKNDTLLLLQQHKNETTIDFVKTNQDIEEYINSVLFTGHYKFLDSLRKNEIVIFSNDEVVKGLNKFEKYSIIFDYNDNIPQYDIISFTASGYQPEWYSYKINQDTLQLYEFDQEYQELNYDSIRKDTIMYSLLKID